MHNEFELYEQVMALISVTEQYEAAQEWNGRLRKISEQMKSRKYRVAVIGEFKRGKSSLVNAIIGAQVLPTDILPMTAAVTRVVYGNERKILIRYKDGREEERTVEQLLDYATKYDAERAKTAADVREIEVRYPSVFCRNHIDILDTPGLNDNEAMTEVTLGVLGDVDAAIVVISACEPLSMTEQQLIVDLISRRQIRHLIFAATHIDAASHRKSEQDRVLSFIEERLCEGVLKQALERFEEDMDLAEKARRILSNPDLFGVSSVQAMDGFIHDDQQLLEDSRFPHFKNELLALLTAAQSGDMTEKVHEAITMIHKLLPQWQQKQMEERAQAQEQVQKSIAQMKLHYEKAATELNARLLQVDEQIEQEELSPTAVSEWLHKELRQCFIRKLSSIRADNNTDAAIRQALNDAVEQTEQKTKTVQLKLQRLRTVLWNAMNRYEKEREEHGLDPAVFRFKTDLWKQVKLPEFSWICGPIPEGDLKGTNVIVYINSAIEEAIAVLNDEIDTYINEWRLQLLQINTYDENNQEPLKRLYAELEKYEREMLYREEKHTAHRETLRRMLEAREAEQE